jgi:hypothetical protein
MGSKKVKQMQNKEEFRQKGHNTSQSNVSWEGEKISFMEGGGKYNFQTKIKIPAIFMIRQY